MTSHLFFNQSPVLYEICFFRFSLGKSILNIPNTPYVTRVEPIMPLNIYRNKFRLTFGISAGDVGTGNYCGFVAQSCTPTADAIEIRVAVVLVCN